MIRSRYLREDSTSRTFPPRDLFPSSLECGSNRLRLQFLQLWDVARWDLVSYRIGNIITHKTLELVSATPTLTVVHFSVIQCAVWYACHYALSCLGSFCTCISIGAMTGNTFDIWNQQWAIQQRINNGGGFGKSLGIAVVIDALFLPT
jgi:hypothetical protein